MQTIHEMIQWIDDVAQPDSEILLGDASKPSWEGKRHICRSQEFNGTVYHTGRVLLPDGRWMVIAWSPHSDRVFTGKARHVREQNR